MAISAADVIGALLIGILTIIAAANVPGLLEMVVLQHLPLTHGVRFAIATVCRYTISIVGLVLFFAALGIGWSKVQWLVAAVSVGLGFGLQEIFANFVSGLIILFERPVRVGDVVTIGDVTGVVTKIRIRATTIRNWDRKELIVPNREFITGRLLNWTLTDETNRVVVQVGVAYGSDTQKACELLLAAAAENELVLKEPAPIATFEGFGDNALTVLLRCYLSSLDNRLATISALHQAINRKFNEAGIVVAFPQRDVHLDTSRPLEIRVNRPRGGDRWRP